MNRLKIRVEKLEEVSGEDSLQPPLFWTTDTDGTCSVSGFTPGSKEYANEAEALAAHPELLDEGRIVIHRIFVEAVNGKRVTRNPDGSYLADGQLFANREELEAARPGLGSRPL